MNEEDKSMMEKLLKDKEKRYMVVVDNDSVWVDDTETGEAVHTFSEFGYHLLVDLFNYFGVDAEYC